VAFDDDGPEAWKNPAVDPAARAKALCANLTIDEKLSLLHGTGWGADVYVGVAKGIPSKGIPDMNLNDGPQGFRCNGLGKCPGGTSTQFPSGLTVAATWDANATKMWGVAMGREFYNKGANVQLGPGMCIARVPKNGRNFGTRCFLLSTICLVD
jgi:beta-glucosidase